MTASPLPRGQVPPGTYAQGGRSPIVWVCLCPPCGGYAAITSEDYSGALSGRCQGCGSESREVHRFRAVIASASCCGCEMAHARVRGDLSPGDGVTEREHIAALAELTGARYSEPGPNGITLLKPFSVLVRQEGAERDAGDGGAAA